VIYVWFDALGNYLTSLGYGTDAAHYRRYWEENPNRVHVIGKGITRFHAVYWPAILLSAGLPLPHRLLVHGYLTVNGEKISKSRHAGPEVNPAALAARFGSDALRYFLLRHTRSDHDGDVSPGRLAKAYQKELAGQLGNLLSRTLSLISRGAEGRIPEPAACVPCGDRAALVAEAERLSPRVDNAVDGFRLHDALDAIFDLVATGNRRLERTAPWKLIGETDPHAAQRLATCLYDAAELLRVVAVHAAPFLPDAAARILDQLGVDPEDAHSEAQRRFGLLRPGTRVRPGDVLFPRLEP
jgi:methionyl-tRNA synthetase